MKTTPKDFFLHLAATITLYIAAIFLLNLAFVTINYALPDRLSGYLSASSIVLPISFLIIVVPLLYVLEWFIVRDIRKENGKRQIWIRRWRIYLTLFLTGATIAGDLIALINTFLNGEISSRFIWKVLSVLLVCALIFVYYIFEKMSDDSKKHGLTQKILAGLGIVFVLAAIIAGFVIVGSPAKQRALRFDSQRVSDLSVIQSQIVSYWQRNEKLPQSLSDLNDPISGFSVPLDPEGSGAAAVVPEYEYIVKGDRSFELCARFNLPYDSKQDQYRGEYYSSYPAYYPGDKNSNWDHSEGRVCFDRTIDPTLYPPVKNVRPVPLD